MPRLTIQLSSVPRPPWGTAACLPASPARRLHRALVRLLTWTPNHFLQNALAPCSDLLLSTPRALSGRLTVHPRARTYYVLTGFSKHGSLSNQQWDTAGLQLILKWSAGQLLSKAMLIKNEIQGTRPDPGITTDTYKYLFEKKKKKQKPSI